MTHHEAVAMVEAWDRQAIMRGIIAKRRTLWNILYALDGWKPAESVIDDLDALVQTPEVNGIRALLGIEMRDCPPWAGNVAI